MSRNLLAILSRVMLKLAGNDCRVTGGVARVTFHRFSEQLVMIRTLDKREKNFSLSSANGRNRRVVLRYNAEESLNPRRVNR